MPTAAARSTGAAKLSVPEITVPAEPVTTAAHGVRPTKLFIGGISRHTTTKQLRDHFSQHGRVLDCVAMRQPDGRSRGFGYVTLDSPVAAEQCLREPQVVDGRIVDLKPAVPEGSSNGKKLDMPLIADSSALGLLQGSSVASSPHSATSPLGSSFGVWPESPSSFIGAGMLGAGIHWWGTQSLGTDASARGMPQSVGALDCVELLSGSRSPTGDSLELPPGLTLPSQGGIKVRAGQENLSANATSYRPMSASAPEFVPADTIAKEPAIAPQRVRKPLGELTNVQANLNGNGKSGAISDIKKLVNLEPVKIPEPVKIAEPVKISEPVVAEPSEIAAPTNSTTEPEERVRLTPPEIEVEEQEQEEEEQCSAAPPTPEPAGDDGNSGGSETDSSAGQDDNEEVFELPAGIAIPEDLPSAGSALHATGECRRCNFYPKGRCQNGKNCTFCHLPHEKRKPSRQEKRERQAAWLQQQAANGNALTIDTSAEILEDEVASSSVVSPSDYVHDVPAFLGLPPVLVSGSKMSDGMLGTSPTSALGLGSMTPPGLPMPQCASPTMAAAMAQLQQAAQGAASWQPDEEASPACLSTFPGAGYSQGFGLLPAPAAPSPSAASVLATSPPSQVCPLAMPTAAGGVPTPAAAAGATRGKAEAGTQTLAPYSCRRCVGDESADADQQLDEKVGSSDKTSACQWTRDELLRIRGAMEAAATISESSAAVAKTSD